uniref:RanBP2-type domain-containing protein n=1 Tax=Chromera velia CCMP2878 TaxID=1169474 RepID=A0A0G4HGQ9_9ALVE|eukprot:Cvel_6756.t1-p1 / transcript=Cvel_6756.t1 / gene=Cvel_6756 / organism=Chromera_velia_CCMP2878 / gene_product=Protein CbbX, putative / transcript_product=Protein CbbX, putative / location=Cvel_scaffold338:72958-96478(+) / protein_length=2902 / sequence_SO=supercontig / SO=protein_coding / is_pseudo=false
MGMEPPFSGYSTDLLEKIDRRLAATIERITATARGTKKKKASDSAKKGGQGVAFEYALKEGAKVMLPKDTDPRLTKMRVGWSAQMAKCCGKEGEVIDMNERDVGIKVEGQGETAGTAATFLWDIELLPPTVERMCLDGCTLASTTVEDFRHRCSVCHWRLPRWAKVRICHTHSYVVCRYCQGRPEIPSVGMVVVRGPTCPPFTEPVFSKGTVTSVPNQGGGVAEVDVKWESEGVGRYLSAPFADVVPSPSPQNSQNSQASSTSSSQLLCKYRMPLKALPKPGDAQQTVHRNDYIVNIHNGLTGIVEQYNKGDTRPVVYYDQDADRECSYANSLVVLFPAGTLSAGTNILYRDRDQGDRWVHATIETFSGPTHGFVVRTEQGKQASRVWPNRIKLRSTGGTNAWKVGQKVLYYSPQVNVFPGKVEAILPNKKLSVTWVSNQLSASELETSDLQAVEELLNGPGENTQKPICSECRTEINQPKDGEASEAKQCMCAGCTQNGGAYVVCSQCCSLAEEIAVETLETAEIRVGDLVYISHDGRQDPAETEKEVMVPVLRESKEDRKFAAYVNRNYHRCDVCRVTLVAGNWFRCNGCYDYDLCKETKCQNLQRSTCVALVTDVHYKNATRGKQEGFPLDSVFARRLVFRVVRLSDGAAGAIVEPSFAGGLKSKNTATASQGGSKSNSTESPWHLALADEAPPPDAGGADNPIAAVGFEPGDIVELCSQSAQFEVNGGWGWCLGRVGEDVQGLVWRAPVGLVGDRVQLDVGATGRLGIAETHGKCLGRQRQRKVGVVTQEGVERNGRLRNVEVTLPEGQYPSAKFRRSLYPGSVLCTASRHSVMLEEDWKDLKEKAQKVPGTTNLDILLAQWGPSVWDQMEKTAEAADSASGKEGEKEVREKLETLPAGWEASRRKLCEKWPNLVPPSTSATSTGLQQQAQQKQTGNQKQVKLPPLAPKGIKKGAQIGGTTGNQQHPPQMGHWRCLACSYVNASCNWRCVLCAENGKDWKCTICGRHNKCTDGVCPACKTVQEIPPTSATTGQTVGKHTGAWEPADKKGQARGRWVCCGSKFQISPSCKHMEEKPNMNINVSPLVFSNSPVPKGAKSKPENAEEPGSDSDLSSDGESDVGEGKGKENPPSPSQTATTSELEHDHKEVFGVCRLCTKCQNCTGFGETCLASRRRPSSANKGGAECGCGSGTEGCGKCGLCAKCAIDVPKCEHSSSSDETGEEDSSDTPLKLTPALKQWGADGLWNPKWKQEEEAVVWLESSLAGGDAGGRGGGNQQAGGDNLSLLKMSETAEEEENEDRLVASMYKRPEEAASQLLASMKDADSYYEPIKTPDELRIARDTGGNCVSHFAALLNLPKTLEALWRLGMSKWVTNKTMQTPIAIMDGVTYTDSRTILIHAAYRKRALFPSMGLLGPAMATQPDFKDHPDVETLHKQLLKRDFTAARVLARDLVTKNIPHAEPLYALLQMRMGYDIGIVEVWFEQYEGKAENLPSLHPLYFFLKYLTWKQRQTRQPASKGKGHGTKGGGSALAGGADMERLRAASALRIFRFFPSFADRWLDDTDCVDKEVQAEGLDLVTEITGENEQRFVEGDEGGHSPSGGAGGEGDEGADEDDDLMREEGPDPLITEWNEFKKANGVDAPSMDRLLHMIGLEDVKRRAMNIIRDIQMEKKRTEMGVKVNANTTMNFLFVGNPGTGKTTAATHFSGVLAELGYRKNPTPILTSANEILNKCPKEFPKLVDSAKGGTLFIDEAYQLKPSAKGSAPNAANGILDTLMKAAEEQKDETSFILAGYKSDIEEMFKYNDGLPSRFPNEIAFEDYSVPQLRKILVAEVKGRGFRLQSRRVCGCVLSKVAARRIGKGRGRKGFGNARSVRNFLDIAVNNQKARIGAAFASKVGGGRGGDGGHAMASADELVTLTRDDVLGKRPDPASSPHLQELEQMIGLRAVKETVKGLMAVQLQNYDAETSGEPPQDVALNRLFVGNPGTGKTTVARIYGNILRDFGFLSNGEVISVTASDLLGAAVGVSGEKTADVINSAHGKVLFIDEAYCLDPLRAGGNMGGASYGAEVLDTIVQKVDGAAGSDIAVILAGYRSEIEGMIRNANPGLKRRFQPEDALVFEDYSDDELEIILVRMTQSSGLLVMPEVATAVVQSLSLTRRLGQFGNAGAVANMLSKAKANRAKRLEAEARSQAAAGPSAKPMTGAARKLLILSDFLGETKDPATSLKRAFEGLQNVAFIEKYMKEFEHIVKGAIKEGRSPATLCANYHFVFHGTAGTGKTTVARRFGALMKGMDLLPHDKVTVTTGTNLQGFYVGETKKKVLEIMKEARGGILLIDEAVGLVNQRGSWGQEALQALVDNMSSAEFNGSLMCIFAGSDADIDHLFANVTDGFRSRFDKVRIKFPTWTGAQAADATVHHLKESEGKSFTSSAVKQLHLQFTALAKLPGWASAKDVYETVIPELQKQRYVRLWTESEAKEKENAQPGAASTAAHGGTVPPFTTGDVQVVFTPLLKTRKKLEGNTHQQPSGAQPLRTLQAALSPTPAPAPTPAPTAYTPQPGPPSSSSSSSGESFSETESESDQDNMETFLSSDSDICLTGHAGLGDSDPEIDMAAEVFEKETGITAKERAFQNTRAFNPRRAHAAKLREQRAAKLKAETEKKQLKQAVEQATRNAKKQQRKLIKAQELLKAKARQEKEERRRRHQEKKERKAERKAAKKIPPPPPAGLLTPPAPMSPGADTNDMPPPPPEPPQPQMHQPQIQTIHKTAVKEKYVDEEGEDDEEAFMVALEEACAELGYSLDELLQILQDSSGWPQDLLNLVMTKTGCMDPRKVSERLEPQRQKLLTKVQQLIAERERVKEEEERKVQEKIRAQGRCPMNFDWLPVNGGYRCAGGTHFISHADVKNL